LPEAARSKRTAPQPGEPFGQTAEKRYYCCVDVPDFVLVDVPVLVLLPDEEPVVAAGALDPVEPAPLVTLPPVVEVPVVVERVPERMFTLVELRLGPTYTPVRRLLMIVVRLSGSLAIT
jgi:hypothetical protein